MPPFFERHFEEDCSFYIHQVHTTKLENNNEGVEDLKNLSANLFQVGLNNKKF